MRFAMDSFNEELGLNIPGHVAVILDGNGRWAKKKHMPRTYGHMQGSKVVEDMLYVADDLGIQYFTVYYNVGQKDGHVDG